MLSAKCHAKRDVLYFNWVHTEMLDVEESDRPAAIQTNRNADNGRIMYTSTVCSFHCSSNMIKTQMRLTGILVCMKTHLANVLES